VRERREIVQRPHTTPLHREFEQYMPTNPHVKQIVDDKTYISSGAPEG
jgi:hypothetical protein